MRIAVVALGKIGLPLAVQYADKGHEVIGVDVNPAVVEAVNAGTEPFPGEAHLAEKLAALSPATGNGALRATTDYAEAIPEADAIVLCLPGTDQTRGMLSAEVLAATSAIRSSGTSVWATRSTTHPGRSSPLPASEAGTDSRPGRG